MERKASLAPACCFHEWKDWHWMGILTCRWAGGISVIRPRCRLPRYNHPSLALTLPPSQACHYRPPLWCRLIRAPIIMIITTAMIIDYELITQKPLPLVAGQRCSNVVAVSNCRGSVLCFYGPPASPLFPSSTWELLGLRCSV